MEEKRVYFKNLNALRFLAAAAVIFHHVEQYKFWAKLPNIWGNVALDALGAKAVSFFFALSGFLITYLLLEEKRKTSHIRIKDFYIRRVLRIWPVYYLVVIICLFVVPLAIDLSFLGVNLYDNSFPLKVLLLFLVLPNLVRLFSPSLVGGNQLWTIGVEEQFYLVWPLLVRFFYRRFIAFLIFFIVAKIAITIGLEYAVNAGIGINLTNPLFRFWTLFKIEQMAIGAIGAWILFNRKTKALELIFHPLTRWLTFGLFALLFVIPSHHWIFSYFESVVFLSVIMNLSVNPALRISLESPLITTLGNISYGIYMYHTLCITACLYLLTHFGVHNMNFLFFNILLYCGSVISTLIVAFFSYEYMERLFLNLKEQFMVIKSGNNNSLPPKEKTLV